MTPAASDPIFVACGADDAYAMPLAVTVRSLLDNLEAGRSVRLFVLDGGLTPSSRRRLLESWAHDRLDVEWLEPDLALLASVKVSGHIPLASYFRLLAADLVPSSVDRLLYLDSDLVVLTSLADLWSVDLDGHPLGAVQDLNAPYVSRPNGLATWGELRLPADRKYWNAGVLLLDLARWRREALGKKVLAYVQQNRGRIRWHDQDGLNAVLGGDCRELDHRWNVSIQSGAPADPALPRSSRHCCAPRSSVISRAT
jgi:lipopolysaccharide biosynthesis glycosyltransferase